MELKDLRNKTYTISSKIKDLYHTKSTKNTIEFEKTLAILFVEAELFFNAIIEDELICPNSEVLETAFLLNKMISEIYIHDWDHFPRLNHQWDSNLDLTIFSKSSNTIGNSTISLNRVRCLEFIFLLQYKKSVMEDSLIKRVFQFENLKSTQPWKDLVEAYEIDVLLGNSLDIHDGLWDEELDFLEGIYQLNFPKVLREFYSLFGKIYQIPYSSNLNVSAYCCVQENSDYFLVRIDNQSNPVWGIKKDTKDIYEISDDIWPSIEIVAKHQKDLFKKKKLPSGFNLGIKLEKSMFEFLSSSEEGQYAYDYIHHLALNDELPW